MENKTENIIFDGNNLSFLERVEPVSALPRLEQDNQSAARQLGIDLDALERIVPGQVSVPTVDVDLVDRKPSQAVAPAQESYSEKIREKWGSMLLSMSDAVLKIFETSDRPFIVVRDDLVVYANKTAMGILGLRSDQNILGTKFLSFVAKEDWHLLVENIGLMLTEEKSIEVRLKTADNKVNKTKFQAIYLDDDAHFSFVLVGERKVKYNPNAGLYDAVTGLPNFYLFEDRVQIAVKNENYKDVRQRKEMIAVVGVSIDNFDELQKANVADFVLKKLASKLVFRLRKSYTVARGLKYQFWVLLNDVGDEGNLEVEIAKIKALFEEPLIYQDTEYVVAASVGYGVYPQQTQSAKKLIELTIEKIKEEQIASAKAMELPEF